MKTVYWKTLGVVHKCTDDVRDATSYASVYSSLYSQVVYATLRSAEMDAIDLEGRRLRNDPLHAIVQKIGEIV